MKKSLQEADFVLSQHLLAGQKLLSLWPANMSGVWRVVEVILRLDDASGISSKKEVCDTRALQVEP